MRTVPTFHNPSSAAPGLDADPNVRKLLGDGTALLRAPGLTEIARLYIGGHLVPESEVITVPTDGSHKNFEDINQPLYMLDKDDQGATIILRSLRSNDGIWQKDQPVYVEGKWDDAKAKKSS